MRFLQRSNAELVGHVLHHQLRYLSVLENITFGSADAKFWPGTIGERTIFVTDQRIFEALCSK